MEEYNKIINAVKTIAKNELPDIDITKILINHKCFYLLSMLTKIDNKNNYVATASNIMMFNKILISTRYKICTPVFDMLQEFSYAVMKGAILSQVAYGDATYRKSGDIDLLVSRTKAK